MEYLLELKFRRASGKIMTLTINGVKPTLSSAEINKVMNSIIDNYVLIPSDDKLVQKLSASIYKLQLEGR